MKTTLIILLAIMCLDSYAKRTRPKKELALNAFTTDGCSAYPDGYLHTDEYEWLHCCMAHDIAYWAGGNYEKKVEADAELNRCVSEASFGAHGKMMEMGVATGGTPHLATSWRWGYGWNRMVSFTPLTTEKHQHIDKMVHTILNEMSLQSFYMNEEQMDYVLESFSEFRAENLEALKADDLKEDHREERE